VARASPAPISTTHPLRLWATPALLLLDQRWHRVCFWKCGKGSRVWPPVQGGAWTGLDVTNPSGVAGVLERNEVALTGPLGHELIAGRFSWLIEVATGAESCAAGYVTYWHPAARLGEGSAPLAVSVLGFGRRRGPVGVMVGEGELAQVF